jgi:hypothetical protein
MLLQILRHYPSMKELLKTIGNLFASLIATPHDERLYADF